MTNSRRHFLKQSTSLLTLTALSPLKPITCLGQQAPAQQTSRRIKTCLKLSMAKEPGTISETFRLLKKIGFDGVEPNAPTNRNRQELLQASKKTGLLIPGVIDSMHWKKCLSSPNEAERLQGRQALEQAIKDSAYYGGKTVLLVPGKVIPKSVTYEDCWKRSIAEIRKTLPVAEKHNIQIAIENVWNNFITQPKEALRYLQEINHPLVGWYLDIGNIVKYNPPQDWFKILPPEKIFRLDIKGYHLPDKRFCKIGQGTVDWQAVMAAADASGFSTRQDAWASAEVSGGDETRLKEIYNNLQKALTA